MVAKMSLYDLLSYLMPGVLALWIFSLLQKEFSIEIIPFQEGITSLTIFLILSYFLGHILQAFGRNIDNFLMARSGGLPSIRLLKDNSPYSDDFKQSLKSLGKKFFKLSSINNDKEIQEFFNLCYSFVEDNNISNKPFLFNSLYTFYRGMIVSSIIGFLTLISLSIYNYLSKDFDNLSTYLPLSLFFLITLRVSINKFKERAENFADSVYRSFYAYAIKQS